MDAESENIVAEVRKLRKKLRQIENLERLDRPLNHEEAQKVARKGSVRSSIREKLKLVQADVSITPDNSSSTPEDFPSEEVGTNLSRSPKQRTAQESVSAQREEEKVDSDARMKRTHDHVEVRQETYEEEADERRSPAGGGKRPKEDAKASSSGSGDHATARRNPNAASTSQTDSTKASQKPQVRGKSEAQKRRERWSKLRFTVQDLEGHNDLISCVDCKDGIALSGSRDTSVKAWNLRTGTERCNLGGHSGAVTSVHLMTAEENSSLAGQYDVDPATSRFALSASTDCTVRLWDLDSHKEILSIYTYNPITAMGVIGGNMCVVTGSGGGKVEMWDIKSGENVFSSLTHDGSVTCVKVKGQNVATASLDGVIKLWELRERSLHVIFESENIRNLSGEGVLVQRPIISLGLADGLVYYGDESTNVKVLDWKKGTVTKLRNHLDEFGSTDAMLLSDDALLFSSYDLDNGVGSINFFSPSDHQFLGSLYDPDTSRIESIAALNSSDSLKCFITAGLELRVWRVVSSNQHSSQDISTTFDPAFVLPAEDSEDDFSESDFSGDEAFTRGPHRRSRRRGSSASEPQPSSWSSWCSII